MVQIDVFKLGGVTLQKLPKEGRVCQRVAKLQRGQVL